MDAPEVLVEVHLANGLPSFTVVGLADTEVKESRDRVRAAIQNARFEFPNRRITVNLAPADLPKDGSGFDLPMALGILAASGQIPADRLDEYEFSGELALTGELRRVRGALAMGLRVARAGRGFVLPKVSAPEAALVAGGRALGAESLLAVCAHLTGAQPLPSTGSGESDAAATDYPDLADVRGQLAAKRALAVAAAGRHSLLMVGPPGTGKSMLAERLAGICPAMTPDEAIEAAAIQSLSDGGLDLRRLGRRPFRSPHHSASAVALVGGGSMPKPGEISLAHHGCLFLDELPEFDRRVLEALREPLESGRITVSRAAAKAEYPARFQLVAAMNPCPCGYLGHASGRCRCTPDQVARYRGRISGPFLDRVDLVVEVPSLSHDELAAGAPGEPSAAVRERVERAFGRQIARQGKANSQLTPREIETQCPVDAAARDMLRRAQERLHLSARAYHRILKVARSIADLDAAPDIRPPHVAEAIQYRRFLGEN
jgi:magnesium chelatase family protein